MVGVLYRTLIFVVTLLAIYFSDLEADYHKFAMIVILVSLLGSINLNADKNFILTMFNGREPNVSERVFEHREASKKLIEIVHNTVEEGES